MGLIYLALGWALGIVIERQMIAPSGWWYVMVVLGVVGTIALWHRGQWRWVGLTLVALALGGLRMDGTPLTSDIAQYNGRSATIEGIVIQPPDTRDSGTQVQVSAITVFDGVQTRDTEGVVLVRLPRRIGDVSYGDRIRITGRLLEPAVFDTFSYADYLARFGIFSIMEQVSLTHVGSGYGSPFMTAIFDLRQSAHALIERALPSPQSAILAGILLGYGQGIDRELAHAFSVAGAAHLLAISGFNMAIVAGIIVGTLKHITTRQSIITVASIIIIGLYTILVGASAGVVRAAVMTSIVMIGVSLKRQAFLPASLAFVVILMSMANPLVLWDVGFQLSFGAVLGIAIFATPLSRVVESWLEGFLSASTRRRVMATIDGPVIISIATLIPTLPLSMLYFEIVSPVILVVNALVIPLHGYAIITGGLATLVGFVAPGIAQVIYWLSMVLVSWTIGVVRWFTDLPYAEVAVSVDWRWVMFFFVVLIGGTMIEATRPGWAIRFAGRLRARWLTHTLLFLGLATAILVWGVALSRPDGKLHIWVLDVGHTNAVLIQSPGGAQVLIDGGQYPARLLTAIGDRMPFYDRTIEVIAVTQANLFNTSALASVLNRYEAGIVLTTGQPNLMVDESPLGEALRGVGTYPVTAGYSLAFSDGMLIEVLAPMQTPSITDRIGDSAMVLRVTYGEMALLLTSEAGRSLQELLLQGDIYPATNILQIPQNGTARSLSADFIEALAPQVALLQVDSANRRGDPDDGVLNLLDALPAMRVLRTDEQGTLHLWTDGSTLWMADD